MPPATLHPQPKRTAVLYGAGLAILLSVTAVVASSWMSNIMAGWVLLKIIVTVRPELADTQHRIWSRAAGTILGGLTAAALALLLPMHGVLLTAGIVALTAVVAFQFIKVHYALYACSLTLAIVLLSGPDTDVIPVNVQRVLFIIITVARPDLADAAPVGRLSRWTEVGSATRPRNLQTTGRATTIRSDVSMRRKRMSRRQARTERRFTAAGRVEQRATRLGAGNTPAAPEAPPASAGNLPRGRANSRTRVVSSGSTR